MSLRGSSIFGNSPSSIIIYHGSCNVIEVPEYGKGKSYNDYGLGFYCTEDKHQSDLWAVDESGFGYTNEYVLNLDGLRVLYLNKFNSFEWLSTLIVNREVSGLSLLAKRNMKKFLDKYPPVKVDDYDVIVGYRADDSYFGFVRLFFEGVITVNYLTKALELGNLGYQVALKSERSFDNLSFVTSHNLNDKSLSEEYDSRDFRARRSLKEFILLSESDDSEVIQDLIGGV